MLHETTTAGDSPGVDVAAFVKYNDLPFVLPPFSLIRDYGQQNTRGNVSKFLLVLRVIDKSDRNSPITATCVTFRPSLRHASGL